MLRAIFEHCKDGDKARSEEFLFSPQNQGIRVDELITFSKSSLSTNTVINPVIGHACSDEIRVLHAHVNPFLLLLFVRSIDVDVDVIGGLFFEESWCVHTSHSKIPCNIRKPVRQRLR